mmetsp:Transcript_54074/g.86564  ORF Transcript_54074/g.86564 Transcript_54074/m.86564 type:complete len:202 (-) Transcript_54074:51-656(-)|eukprot:CAMPEP_0197055582 /NCGR_PEP_ID=MMETSP1384-20130603/68738_1 /TAXON_ID=29189 /ORGANISM="Ammonia sp." /LENGTH=201 /DNA_ID=CAMNT_0042489207 /DNA_START=83 /DNA_END=688 /DNA_ORIENTATION=-
MLSRSFLSVLLLLVSMKEISVVAQIASTQVTEMTEMTEFEDETDIETSTGEYSSMDGTGSVDSDNVDVYSFDGSASSDEVDDKCTGLSKTACADAEDTNGDQSCGFNSASGECYAVTKSDGQYGSGNYDDGFISAKEMAAQEAKKLEIIVGVLGALVGLLTIAIAGGVYYIWMKQAKADIQICRAVSEENIESEAPMITEA